MNPQFQEQSAEPDFKVGDRVSNPNGVHSYKGTVREIHNGLYTIDDEDGIVIHLGVPAEELEKA